MTTQWTADNFSRRRYTVEGDDLDKAKRITVTIHVDGKKVVEMQAREPGIVAIVSRPAEQGFDLEIVEPGKGRFIDYQMMTGQKLEPVAPWQLDALQIK